jgi:phenylalanyl-tRNA synthetase beta subunit
LIAYDINRIAPIVPSYSVIGSTLLSEDATEGIRQIGANNGYIEMYNFVLISLQDGFRFYFVCIYIIWDNDD